MGGGHRLDRAGIQLRVDGRTVRSTTGRSLKNPKNEEVIDWQSFDVGEFNDMQAFIRIVDVYSGGWGHTCDDHMFQSDKPMPSSIPASLSAAKPASKGQTR